MMLRYRLSTLLYVIVPPNTRKLAIASLQLVSEAPAPAVPQSGTAGSSPAPLGPDAPPKVALRILLRNEGSIHLRPKHWIELRDDAGTVVYKTEPASMFPILPGRERNTRINLPVEILLKKQLQLKYFIDTGVHLPLQVALLPVGLQ